MTSLSRDEELRAIALREANVFLTFRLSTISRGSSQVETPRLPDLADVARRLEHHLRTGEMPLDKDWVPSDPPAAVLYRGQAELPPDETHPEIPSRRCGRISAHVPHDHGTSSRAWCDGKPVEVSQETSGGP